ncbi:FAD-dependent monooxygenase [Advenella alkanexedens]|uniref:FAD-dependent monooxygenase n=1 Tax=Advenella alkanexedens TaxID=1481665 RepID=A0ABS6NQ33_9BURK|nr:FAD-dependent monooxygenase [Advenella alkanexedens]MBV4397737.1 FAD-dependent monooxygenase [Advenella alkanexedens]
MHLPSTEPRFSLYYDYKIHQPWLASQHAPQDRKQVVIVGAGPSGLVTALELARLGVSCVVVTAELQVSQGSRALAFTRRSMEILQQVGIDERMTEAGLPWRFGNSYYRGKRVFRMEAPYDVNDRFYPLINVQQQYMEEFLHDACKANPLIDFRWGNKVVQVEQKEGYVELVVDTPEGTYSLETQWLVAADGGRSGIRAALGLEMEGTSYEGKFVIADIKIDLPLPTERMAFFAPEWNPGNTILMHREPHGIWRLDYQLPEGEDPDEALKPESIKARIDAQLAMIGYADKTWELDWCSVYSARTLTLPDYVHDNILFTGDAAHLLPIFGVRGANTGFQDGQSLAWHLAFVVKGLASRKLLENYSAERVTAAREIIEEAGKSTRFMTPPSRGFHLLRDAVLSLSLTQAFVRPLYHWRTSRPHEYTHSALNSMGDDNALFQAGPAHGAPPKNVRLGADNYLLDYLGGGFDLLYFTQNQTVPESIMTVVRQARAKGIPLNVVGIGPGLEIAGADKTINDASGAIRGCYGVNNHGAAYLLRPDQHICARWINLDAMRLQMALNTALPQ